jgi:hypothetical protein
VTARRAGNVTVTGNVTGTARTATGNVAWRRDL